MAEQQLVVFGMDGEEFGIDISSVREIVRLQSVTAVPQSPRFVEGIVNLRGQIVPIVDLSRLLGANDASVADASQRRIIVVRLDAEEIGILVDSVSEILRVPGESVEPPPAIAANGVEGDFLRGVAKVDERLIMILDLGKVFSFRRDALPGRK